MAVNPLAVVAGCGSEPNPDKATLEITSGKDANASVSANSETTTTFVGR